MRGRHKLDYNQPNNFSISTDEATQQLFGAITGTVAVVAFPVVGISLVIGGIVIMNIMLATVTERTREIGIRKPRCNSPGYTDSIPRRIGDVVRIGRGHGTLIGGRDYDDYWPIRSGARGYSIMAPVIAISVSTLVGVFFGFIRQIARRN